MTGRWGTPASDRGAEAPEAGTEAQAEVGRGAAGDSNDKDRGGGWTIALAGAEFGWGSAGKLSAIVAALRSRSSRPPRLVGLGSALGRPLLAEHRVDRWYDIATADPAAVAAVVRTENVRAAVVVLDGPAATALEAAGVPTVFVDSLPFLWSEGDRPHLPLEVSLYCAQRAVELPSECRGVLAAVRRLRWVEAVVATHPAAPRPAGERRVPFRRALLTLGGLRSPSLRDWAPYPRLVLPAALDALREAGVQEVRVTGNLPSGSLAVLCPAGPGDGPLRVTAGPLPHGAFLEQLASVDVLLASPGLTTLLEAGALGTPVVCLPPQNLSQVFNGRFHSRAVGASVRARWPAQVFAEEHALAARLEGEEPALRVVYDGIARAAAEDAEEVRRAVREEVLAALRQAARGADWTGLAAAVGTGGAAQVADGVLSLLRGAHGRGPRREAIAP
ncbi:hydroxymethylcytosylglucuronate/cytosylglucuronate synthase [Streptomyces sp. URMC 123]|uniref:hydroxymethylcytosylglucuronate/cytosylglucurona te synthase n=1 Tax=Streptomyces sp. URMC 123 TaxID=3423403 RepID=UPI003F19DA69